MDLLGEGAVSGLALPFLSSMLDLGGKGREGDDGGIVVYHLCVCVSASLSPSGRRQWPRNRSSEREEVDFVDFF